MVWCSRGDEGLYYFDLKEMYNNLYRKFYYILNARTLHDDPRNKTETYVEQVMQYCIFYGLRVSSVLKNPIIRDYLSQFNKRLRVYRILIKYL